MVERKKPSKKKPCLSVKRIGREQNEHVRVEWGEREREREKFVGELLGKAAVNFVVMPKLTVSL